VESTQKRRDQAGGGTTSEQTLLWWGRGTPYPSNLGLQTSPTNFRSDSAVVTPAVWISASTSYDQRASVSNNNSYKAVVFLPWDNGRRG